MADITSVLLRSQSNLRVEWVWSFCDKFFFRGPHLQVSYLRQWSKYLKFSEDTFQSPRLHSSLLSWLSLRFFCESRGFYKGRIYRCHVLADVPEPPSWHLSIWGRVWASKSMSKSCSRCRGPCLCFWSLGVIIQISEVTSGIDENMSNLQSSCLSHWGLIYCSVSLWSGRESPI